MSASTLRSTTIAAFLSPFMKTLYDKPCSRTAALMRVIHRLRKSRFLLRRSRYAYWPARITPSLAIRETLLRRPRENLGRAIAFFLPAGRGSARLDSRLAFGLLRRMEP